MSQLEAPNNPSTDPATTPPPNGELTKIKVIRDETCDLIFEGWLRGEGESNSSGNSGLHSDWQRGANVKIYRTTSGKFVLVRERWTRFHEDREWHEAHVFDSPGALLAALKEKEGGMKPEEKEAWAEACKRDELLKKICNEEI